MQVGINLYSKWPYEEIIDAFLENGIDRTFVCFEHPQFDAVMQALEKAKITVENIHAPFKGQNTVWKDGDEGEAMLAKFIACVDACAKYGVPLMVGHVSNGRPMPPISEIGLARFDRLVAHAKEKGVLLAYENHRYTENVEFILNRYPETGFCLDTAHEDAFTPGVRYLPKWGHRLVATHISDNDVVCDKDMHMLPFDGNIDFDKTARELVEFGREVTLMLEIKPDNHEKYKDVIIKDYYRAAAQSIRKLAAMVDVYKKEIKKM